jgi:hypothetical protein
MGVWLGSCARLLRGCVLRGLGRCHAPHPCSARGGDTWPPSPPPAATSSLQTFMHDLSMFPYGS